MTSKTPLARLLVPLLMVLVACTSADSSDTVAVEDAVAASDVTPETETPTRADAADVDEAQSPSTRADAAGADEAQSTSTPADAADVDEAQSPATSDALDSLPMRTGDPEESTGGVPHIQIGAVRVHDFAVDLGVRAYSVPGIENRASVVSMAGATSLWLSSDIELARPEILPAGREFGHIHADGSMHLWLPIERAVEVQNAQWGELHPWVDRDGFWEGVVMVWSPESSDDVDVSLRLIVDAYNFHVGANLDASDFDSPES